MGFGGEGAGMGGTRGPLGACPKAFGGLNAACMRPGGDMEPRPKPAKPTYLADCPQ